MNITTRLRAAGLALALLGSSGAFHAVLADTGATITLVVRGTGAEAAVDGALRDAPVDALPELDAVAVTVPEGAAGSVARELSRRPGVEEVAPATTFTIAGPPSDPYWPSQKGARALHLEDARKRMLGHPATVVAVVDTGVQAVPDLAGALLPGRDFVGSGDDDPTDENPGRHGTAVAQVIAARADNGIGTAGICAVCSILPVRVLDAAGTGSEVAVAQGIVYAADRRADVINLSLAGPAGGMPSKLISDAIAYARERGAIVVASAGNQGSMLPTYPAADAMAIGVAGSLQHADSTARDSRSNYGAWVDVAAAFCVPITELDGSLGGRCGTSFSAPLVAGVAGLLRSVDPDISEPAVRSLLANTATPVDYVMHGVVSARAVLEAPAALAGDVTPIRPARVVDTRTGLGSSGAVGPGASRTLKVTGVGGVPPTGVSAVVVNVTAVSPTRDTYLTVWPTGTAMPTASNLNLRAGETRPNLVVTKVSPSGTIDVYNYAGNTDVLVDVTGYISDRTGAPVTGIAPARVLDTRTGLGSLGPVAPGATRKVRVTGVGGVPIGASAVVLNLTAVSPTRDTYLTVWPSDGPRPGTSNINLTAGETRPNLVVTKVAPDGTVNLFNYNGHTHVLFDVTGYVATGSGTPVTPVRPARVLDTRRNLGASGAVPAGQTRTVRVTGVGVPRSGVSAVVLNLTAVSPTRDTYLTVWPSDRPRPGTSNINLTAGETRPNLVVTRVAPDGTVKIFNYNGDTHVIFDVVGYLSAG